MTLRRHIGDFGEKIKEIAFRLIRFSLCGYCIVDLISWKHIYGFKDLSNCLETYL